MFTALARLAALAALVYSTASLATPGKAKPSPERQVREAATEEETDRPEDRARLNAILDLQESPTDARPLDAAGHALPESEGIVRTGTRLTGTEKAWQRTFHGPEVFLTPAAGEGKVFGGQRYVEFTNPASFDTTDRSGAGHEIVLVRAIRPYTAKVSAKSFNGNQGYQSDVLAFELTGEQLTFKRTLLRSVTSAGVLGKLGLRPSSSFEDARVSVVDDPDGQSHYLMSMTDYASHIPSSSNPDVMNRQVELTLDARGVPLAVKTGLLDQRPRFGDLSPKPERDGSGTWHELDAKNATQSINGKGQFVVRTRYRGLQKWPGYQAFYAKHPDLKPLPASDYGEQVLIFKDREEASHYDYAHAVEDLLLGYHGLQDPSAALRVRPLTARILADDRSYRDFYPDALKREGGITGFGNGTPPLRLTRDAADRVWVSRGPFDPAPRELGKVPADLTDSFVIARGASAYLEFGHQLRNLYRSTPDGLEIKDRHYDMQVRLLNDDQTEYQAAMVHALQPLAELEHQRSGIRDLAAHVYAMGVTKSGNLWYGAKDAHALRAKVDFLKILGELSASSSRWQSGQVFRPLAPRSQSGESDAVKVSKTE